ncbi:hypothetical protein FACS1894110_18330 [Spirochaetia bacterium]|nr:hypothetical protein FACS1894110_18330 [Spirochaetia bacterium]
MNELLAFNFEGKQVNAFQKDGEPWFVAKEVAGVLGYADGSNPARLFDHVPEEWKGVNPIHTPGGKQNMLCLSEQGLYFFLARSDKPAALPFQKWIAGEVVPAIRKTGSYDQKNAQKPPAFAPVAINDWRTIRELRLAANKGYITPADFRARLGFTPMRPAAPIPEQKLLDFKAENERLREENRLRVAEVEALGGITSDREDIAALYGRR